MINSLRISQVICQNMSVNHYGHNSTLIVDLLAWCYSQLQRRWWANAWCTMDPAYKWFDSLWYFQFNSHLLLCRLWIMDDALHLNRHSEAFAGYALHRLTSNLRFKSWRCIILATGTRSSWCEHLSAKRKKTAGNSIAGKFHGTQGPSVKSVSE